MSHEPPRVNFPGGSFRNENSAPNSGQFNNRRPNRDAGRLVAIVLGTLFTFLFLCAGGAFVTYRRFNADSNFGGRFKELREPIGGAIPDKTREVARRAVAAESKEAMEVTEWLENGYPEVDESRLVMEMQRSGLSNGSVNPLTRALWTLNLDEALEPPELGDHAAVLDFEWLVEGKEARAVVASFESYGDDSSIYVLYLNRKDDQWQLFDWRDLLLPMSEAQYWAVYAGLDEAQDQTYHDFTDAAYERYTNGTRTTPEKIKQTMASYKQTKFPRRYTTMAQNALCSWLVVYEAKEELAEVVKQLKADEFAGAWLYKAQSAAWSNETELAFQCLGELNKQVGWHPKAAQMAAEIARTPEQKHLATEWSQRSVLLAPVNSNILNNYFKIADRQQMESLFQQIAKTKQPSANAIKLVESLGYLEERHLRLLADLMQPIAELRQAREYLDFKLAVAQEDYAEVLKLAPKVMQLKSPSETGDLVDSVDLWNNYLTAAAKSNSLMLAAEQVPDRYEFLTKLRDRATYGYFELPPKETAALLKSIPAGHSLLAEIQTSIAIACMDIRQGNADEAFDSLLAIYKESRSSATDRGTTDEELMDFDLSFHKTLGAAALASERWRELTNLVDPEVLLLILAWSQEIETDQLNQVLAWYEGIPNQAALWPKYLRASSAFANGDWPTADRLIVEAIRLAKLDARVTEDSLPPRVALLVYDGDDDYEGYADNIVSRWIGERMSYATRCNALERLVADAQVADELDAAWVARISENYSMVSVESQVNIASMLKASPLSAVQELAEEIRASQLVLRGNYAEGFDRAIIRAKGLDRDSYEQRFALKSAGSQLIMLDDKRRLETLRQASQGTEAEAYVECVAATLDRNIPALCKAIERWEAIDWHFDDFVNLEVMKRLQGVPNLRDVFVVQPFDMSVTAYACEDSLIVLATETTQAAIVFEGFLKSKGITYSTLEHSRFDQATAAVEVKTGNGEFVLTFGLTDEEAFAKNSLIKSFAKDARSIVICTRKDIAMEPYHTRQIAMRTNINDLLEGLPSAIALRDMEGTSVYFGEGWQERFGQSLQTGIDPAHPKEFYELLKPKNLPGFIERDGQSFVVLGEARELIPVKLQPQESPWLAEVGVTLAPSILVPCLPADVLVTFNR